MVLTFTDKMKLSVVSADVLLQFAVDFVSTEKNKLVSFLPGLQPRLSTLQSN